MPGDRPMNPLELQRRLAELDQAGQAQMQANQPPPTLSGLDYSAQEALRRLEEARKLGAMDPGMMRMQTMGMPAARPPTAAFPPMPMAQPPTAAFPAVPPQRPPTAAFPPMQPGQMNLAGLGRRGY